MSVRNQEILALSPQFSYGEIAQILKISRNAVAGVVWRKRWPIHLRIHSPNSKRPNKCGTGRRRAQEAVAHG